MTLKIGIAIAALLVLGYLLLLRRGDIDGAAARRLVEGGATLVDVRTPGEFAEGHVDGAINVPVQDLEQRMAELGPKDKPIVVYCRSGVRSRSAARTLTNAGYVAVHNLGAMGRW